MYVCCCCLLFVNVCVLSRNDTYQRKCITVAMLLVFASVSHRDASVTKLTSLELEVWIYYA